jgi:putative phage-type endonuclease
MALTATQLATRIEGLGGSEALAYCGKDPRCSPLQLYLRKIGEAGDRPASLSTDPRMDWGVRLEPVVRDWLAEQLGVNITVPQHTHICAKYPFLFGNLDGVIDTLQEGVEIKTGDKFTSQDFGDVETDQVPVRYVLQCTHYMLVSGLKRFHLAALLGGNDARHYVIDYDAELGSVLLDRALRFWNHVTKRVPPDPVNLHDADKRWPESKARSVVATDIIVSAVEDLKRLRQESKRATDQADDIELTLKAFMGDADALIAAQQVRPLATWRSQSRDSFDVRTFTEAHPDMAQQYRRVSSYRVFRVK